jgi:hypothetical protein
MYETFVYLIHNKLNISNKNSLPIGEAVQIADIFKLNDIHCFYETGTDKGNNHG